MVKIALQISAQLENVTHLKTADEDFRWYLKLRCLNCGEETADFVYCTLTDSAPLKGGRGSASLVLKCKLCSRENSIDIMKETLSPYTAEDAGKFKSIVTFDCRGVEPTDFSPRVDWIAEGAETKSVFPDIDLGLKEWYDYDERGQQSVSITELQYRCLSANAHRHLEFSEIKREDLHSDFKNTAISETKYFLLSSKTVFHRRYRL